MQSLSKIAARFLVDIDKLIEKCIWRSTDLKIAKTILMKENRMGRITT